jgi:hypothetical protein
VEIGIPLIIVAAVLLGVSVLLQRSRKRLEAEQGITVPSRRRPAAPPPPPEPFRPRPAVASFHVAGEEARVAFDVAYPEGDDEVLTELLLHEAVEVVREKRHTLPIHGVTEVVALARRGGEEVVVGRVALETPGQLPPPLSAPPSISLVAIAADPLEHRFEDHLDRVPAAVVEAPSDELEPLSQIVRLPRAIDTGLRAQGIDPAGMSASDLVTGMLKLVGYAVQPALQGGAYVAEKAGARTFLFEDPYRPGDHPELGDDVIRRFLVEFQSSGAERGLLVSEKYGPFGIYDKERREPRVRFLTRERLQKFVDSVALG